jgi:hypothetical protein
MALSRASSATPTSAKMANHIEVIPKKANTIIKSFTPKANIIF